MKDFLGEYGFAILAAIVVILLIAMCTPVGNLIKNQIMGVVDNFATKTETKLYSLDADNTVGIILIQDGDEGKFTISATSLSDNDLLNAEYRVKDQNGNWSEWRVLGPLSTGSKEHTGSFTAKIENGNKAQVRVTDSGKADSIYFESNIVEYTGTSSQTENFEGGSSTPTVDMPTKGDLISIKGSQYRVLSVSGTQAKVLAMSDAQAYYEYNDSSITTSFGGTNGQKYEGSKLDNYLENTWYTGLSQDMKDAIVAQDITQNMFNDGGTPVIGSSWYKMGFIESDTSGSNYTLSKVGSTSVGSRHVYALDVQDVIDYLGSSFTPQDLNEMFWSQRSTIEGYVWLRSASADFNGNAFFVGGIGGSIGFNLYNDGIAVRSAFIIDLSKIDFE